MKVARTYTLDHEIVERLVNINASDLINTLLKDHFSAFSKKNTILEGKKESFKQLFKKKRNFPGKLKSWKNGIVCFLITIRNFGLNLVRKNQQEKKSKLTLTTETSPTHQKSSRKVGN